MATYSGRNQRVTLGEDLVLKMANWNLDINSDENDTSAFGSVWKTTDAGMQGWSATVSGHYDAKDATGQEALEAAQLANSLVGNLRFYVKHATTGEVIYWAPDLTADMGDGVGVGIGGRVTGVSIKATNSDVAKVDFKISGSGPIKKITENVT